MRAIRVCSQRMVLAANYYPMVSVAQLLPDIVRDELLSDIVRDELLSDIVRCELLDINDDEGDKLRLSDIEGDGVEERCECLLVNSNQRLAARSSQLLFGLDLYNSRHALYISSVLILFSEFDRNTE